VSWPERSSGSSLGPDIVAGQTDALPVESLPSLRKPGLIGTLTCWASCD